MKTQAEYSAKWYKANKETQRQRALKRRKEIQEWLFSLKAGKKCSYCQEHDPVCLDWHHIKGVKVADISNIPPLGWGREKALKEISKCVLICANCHRKEHARLAQLGRAALL